MYQFELLGDFFTDQGIAADGVWRPSASDGNTELGSGEVAEIVYMEIVPPVTALGVRENLEFIMLTLDGRESPHISLHGGDLGLMAPPKTNIQGNLVAFGTPMFNAVKTGAPLLTGTCLKFKNDMRVTVRAGAAAVTAAFRIRLWGYKYDAGQLSRAVQPTLGGQVSINDRRRNRTLRFTKPNVRLNADGWTQLPGGINQAYPKINPFMIYARNANATTPNEPYQFRHDTDNVGREEENMRWDYDRFTDVRLITGLGVRAPTNLQEVFLNIDGRQLEVTPTTEFLNPLHFGRAFPLMPDTLPLYHPIPKLANPHLVWNEIGWFGIRDDGTAVGANNCLVAMNGTIIELVRE